MAGLRLRLRLTTVTLARRRPGPGALRQTVTTLKSLSLPVSHGPGTVMLGFPAGFPSGIPVCNRTASEPEQLQPYRADSERAHVAAPGGAGANAELLFQLGFSALSELEGAFQTKGCTFRIKRACVSVHE